jgi:hypothetical protein
LQNPIFKGLNNLQSIGDGFMGSCMSLINPNFSGLKVLNYLGRDAMVDCPNITQNQIDKLYTIAKVGGYNIKNT